MRNFGCIAIIFIIFAVVFSKNMETAMKPSVDIKTSVNRKELIKTLDNYVKDPNLTYGFKSNHIKVYVNDKAHRFITEKAFNTWQRFSNNLVNFEFITDEKTADIGVYYYYKTSGSTAFGFSTSNVNQRTRFLVNSKIEIYLADPIKRTYLNDSMVYSILLHEIGHSLGIIDHSENKNDVMKESSEVLSNDMILTQRDINSLKIIYAR